MTSYSSQRPDDDSERAGEEPEFNGDRGAGSDSDRGGNSERAGNNARSEEPTGENPQSFGSGNPFDGGANFLNSFFGIPLNSDDDARPAGGQRPGGQPRGQRFPGGQQPGGQRPGGNDPMGLGALFGAFGLGNAQQRKPGGPGQGGAGRGRGGSGGGGKGERPLGAPKRRSPLLITLIILGFIGMFLWAAAQFYTEVLWFNQIKFSSVFWTSWFARAVMFLIGFVVSAAALLFSLTWAYRSRPGVDRQSGMERYRQSIDPMRKVLFIAIPLMAGVFFGTSLASQWQTILLWWNGSNFGQVDPIFHKDISFFVFTLPFVRTLVSFLLMVAIGSTIAGLAVSYLYGGVRTSPKLHFDKPSRIHASLAGALVVLFIAVNYWLDRYSLLVGQQGKFAGAGYTDIHANLPAKAILAGIALVVVVLFILTAVRGSWKLPAVGVGLMVVSALVLGMAYPMLIQKFKVDPNAAETEERFIQYNIESTLQAYGLEDVETQTYTAKTETEAGQLREDSESTASIRLLDPNVVSPTFRQLQQNRQYYNFPQQLTVDRYTIDGESRDTVIAVRELHQDGLEEAARTWVNDHTVYTHGFGVVAARGNTTATDGRPLFMQQGIPSTGVLGEYEPRVYFGEKSPSYSIVGAPEGTNWELDYPDDASPNGQVNTNYQGNGGPSLGNLFNQVLYAIKFGSWDILFSDRVTEHSQILYDRHPRDRVAKVAPYLTLDGRAYPAVVDRDGDESTPKELVWIVDGYTTSNNYPYSARAQLEQATADSLSTGQEIIAPSSQLNYIRNSVKAVVNAYDGSVTLYQWDEQDPVLKAWMAIFPDTVTPKSEITGDLMSHLRYPEDLFKVQRELLTRYHVTDAKSFYSRGDFWKSPNDPTSEKGAVPQPPYYLTMKMPGQDEATFSLTSSFIPGGNTDREVLTGFLAVDAEPGNEDGKVREGYGKLRILELPRDLTVPGPGQVQNMFNSTPRISNELNLLAQNASQVIRGNLLTLPVGDGLLYVQPVYVQSSKGTQFPLLHRVAVAFGDEIGYAATLDEALDEVFGGDSGAKAGDAGVDGSDRGDTPGDDAPPPAARDALKAALKEASDAMKAADEAMKAGDWKAYGEAQARLQKALEDAVAAETEDAAGTTPGAAPEATPSPAATP